MTASAAPTVELTSSAPEPPAVRAAPLPMPDAEAFTARVPATAKGQAQTNVFFLNYDGVTLKKGKKDDSATNTTVFANFVATYAPYGDGNKRAASLQAVKSDWAKYDVVVTDQRPKGGIYTMSVNSPTNVFGKGVLGVAPLDCGDNRPANIVLAFHSASDQFSASTQATTMSQEIAHAYGLEHVNQPNDIMNPYNAGGDPTFLDQCLKLDGGGNPIQCNEQHEMFCESGRQNSHAEVMWLFGDSAPDVIPPEVTITSPKQGEQFIAPAKVDIIAEASDDVAVAQVDLFIDGVDQEAPDTTQPYQWAGAGFPAGTFCVKVQARDDEPNIVMSDEVCFTVVQEGEEGTGGDTSTSGEEPGGETTGGHETGGGETGGGETGGGEPAPEPEPEDEGEDTSSSSDGPGEGELPEFPAPADPSYPPGFGEDGDDGCGCTQAPSPGSAGLLVLAAFGLLRRRRKG